MWPRYDISRNAFFFPNIGIVADFMTMLQHMYYIHSKSVCLSDGSSSQFDRCGNEKVTLGTKWVMRACTNLPGVEMTSCDNFKDFWDCIEINHVFDRVGTAESDEGRLGTEYPSFESQFSSTLPSGGFSLLFSTQTFRLAWTRTLSTQTVGALLARNNKTPKESLTKKNLYTPDDYLLMKNSQNFRLMANSNVTDVWVHVLI